MALASRLNWIPKSLYRCAVMQVIDNVDANSFSPRLIEIVPYGVLFDLFYELYNQGRLCLLGLQIGSLTIFEQLLHVAEKRLQLHRLFQALMDHGVKLSKTLAVNYASICKRSSEVAIEHCYNLGMSLGGFLCDAGWYLDAQEVFASCQSMLERLPDASDSIWLLKCLLRQMHALNSDCQFEPAERVWIKLNNLHAEIEKDSGKKVNKAAIYGEACGIYFAKSRYNEAYSVCMKALAELHSDLPTKVIIDVLRQATKACVVKRKFTKAERLIKFAVYLAKEKFGKHHDVYSHALLDYGFYLINMDATAQAVEIYQLALDIRMAVFGGNNLHVAMAQEDLAYCLYVNEYSSGQFARAKEHAEKAIDIISLILGDFHLLTASPRRVKALILEEMAIDSQNKEVEERLLQQAQELHVSSLQLARATFGEVNLQTAKHYGNIGRLYQSMQKFADAEQMHRKAIVIKESLLGDQDYEVALSLGHLASLYNYDMKDYAAAEQLYLKSIQIGINLFGEGYSGLEYDYRGLLKLYNALGDQVKVVHYQDLLCSWGILRLAQRSQHQMPLEYSCPESIEEVMERFFVDV